MTLGSIRRDLPVLANAVRNKRATYCFVPASADRGLLGIFPGLRETFVAGEGEASWRSKEFWTRGDFSNAKEIEPGSSAVFLCDLSDIPDSAVTVLKRLRFREIAFKSEDGWQLLDLGSAMLGPARAALKAGRKSRELMANTRLLARKAVLKKYAVDIRQAGAGEFSPETGLAYTSSVPFLEPFSDGTGIERSSIALFEESAPLVPHQPHAAIREQGGGRYSLWGPSLYFSSTDGSDPRSNGRRYRYVDMTGGAQRYRKILGIGQSALASKRPLKIPGIRSLSAPAESFEEGLKSEYARTAPRGFQNLSDDSREVCIFITNLGPGGAERQMSYLAKGLTSRGHKVRVLTYFQSSHESLHYKPVLESEGVQVEFMNDPHPAFEIAKLAAEWGVRDLELISKMPALFRDEVWALYTHLMVNRPQVLHCWLDQSNIVGAIAGYLAGVPRIVLSSRSVNPTHFPHIYRDWYQSWYTIISRCPRVSWVANSAVGAASYAEWMSYPPERIRVVNNGLDLPAIELPSPEKCQAFRDGLGISSDAIIVTAVFRMSHEKRPLRFIRLVWELRKRYPNLHGMIAGIGPMEDMVRREISNLRMEDSLHLLGKWDDVPLVMRASDVVVLCSSVEGLPNVLIEAGWLGRPVVTTEVGNVCEIVQNGKTGFICPRDEFRSLYARTEELVANQDMRNSFGEAARELVRGRFSMERMIDEMSQVLQLHTAPPGDNRLCA